MPEPSDLRQRYYEILVEVQREFPRASPRTHIYQAGLHLSRQLQSESSAKDARIAELEASCAELQTTLREANENRIGMIELVDKLKLDIRYNADYIKELDYARKEVTAKVAELERHVLVLREALSRTHHCRDCGYYACDGAESDDEDREKALADTASCAAIIEQRIRAHQDEKTVRTIAVDLAQQNPFKQLVLGKDGYYLMDMPNAVPFDRSEDQHRISELEALPAQQAQRIAEMEAQLASSDAALVDYADAWINNREIVGTRTFDARNDALKREASRRVT